MEELPETPAPTSVHLDRDRALEITWHDSKVSSFVLDDLRRACTCAECRGLRQTGRSVGPPVGTPISAIDAHLVGNWGISIAWSDGHDTGIYAWSHLRASLDE